MEGVHIVDGEVEVEGGLLPERTAADVKEETEVAGAQELGADVARLRLEPSFST